MDNPDINNGKTDTIVEECFLLLGIFMLITLLLKVK